MFARLPPKTMEELLGLVPGELDHSAVMQGLFGVGFWNGDGSLTVPYSLGVLLEVGHVKLRPSQDNQNEHIGDYMSDAHEYLTFTCAKRVTPCTGPEDDWGSVGWYANKYWSEHLGCAKPSGRLFETLRRVDIRRHDVELVIDWLEESPNKPEDILPRWHAARVEHGTRRDLPSRPPVCILDQVLTKYYRKRGKFQVGKDRDNNSATGGGGNLEMDNESGFEMGRESNSKPGGEKDLETGGGNYLKTDSESDWETDGENNLKVDGGSHPEMDRESNSKADGGSDPEVDGESDPEADRENISEADEGSDPEVDGESDLEADRGGNSRADGGGDPGTDEESDPETDEGDDSEMDEGSDPDGEDLEMDGESDYPEMDGESDYSEMGGESDYLDIDGDSD
ncbi:hypothetical protein BD779DRAFT_118392 [Infundibulicybe gibba]|nr:hypothetical protein BD779DRAFT_118392 [Infundibulicybe gibba]